MWWPLFGLTSRVNTNRRWDVSRSNSAKRSLVPPGLPRDLEPPPFNCRWTPSLSSSPLTGVTQPPFTVGRNSAARRSDLPLFSWVVWDWCTALLRGGGVAGPNEVSVEVFDGDREELVDTRSSCIADDRLPYCRCCCCCCCSCGNCSSSSSSYPEYLSSSSSLGGASGPAVDKMAATSRDVTDIQSSSMATAAAAVVAVWWRAVH